MTNEPQPSYDDILKTTLLQMIDAVKKTGDWVVGQIPDVLHELIVWTVVKGVIGVAWIAVYFLVAFLIVKKIGKATHDAEFVWGAVAGFSVLGLFLVGIPFFYWVMDGAQAIFAPKLFLLEYASSMIHRVS